MSTEQAGQASVEKPPSDDHKGASSKAAVLDVGAVKKTSPAKSARASDRKSPALYFDTDRYRLAAPYVRL